MCGFIPVYVPRKSVASPCTIDLIVIDCDSTHRMPPELTFKALRMAPAIPFKRMNID